MQTVRNFTTLISGADWRDATGAIRTDITFGFADTVLPHQEGVGTQAFEASFQSLSAAERDIARDAFAFWDSVSALTLTEVAAEAADIVVGVYEFDFDPDASDALGFAFFPGTFDPLAGDVFIDDDSALEPDLYLHEIGHALGLKHPFEQPNLLIDGLDIRSNTVMGQSDLMGGPPGVFDIQAVQFIYGAPDPGEDSPIIMGDGSANQIRGTAEGDAILGLRGADRLRGAAGDDVMAGGGGRDTVIGGGGDDAVDGGGGGDRVVGRAGDDQLAGGGGADTLIGGPGADILLGGRGSDRLIGGGDADTFQFIRTGGIDRIADFDFAQDFIFIQDLARFDQLTITDAAAGAFIRFDGFRIIVEDAAAEDFRPIDFGLFT